MKKYASYLVTSFLFFPLMFAWMQAQTVQLKKSVIGSGGMIRLSNADGTQISSQTGQFIIETLEHSVQRSANYFLNQGFWVPNPVNVTSVEEQFGTKTMNLYNYPNPVSTHTTIAFNLDVSSNVTLRVFDLMGNEVITLLDDFRAAGLQKMEWDAKGYNGLELTDGTYFYELVIRPTNAVVAGSFNSYILRNMMLIVR